MKILQSNNVNAISFGPYTLNHFLAGTQRPFSAQFIKKSPRNIIAIHLVVNSWGPSFNENRDHPEMKNLLTEEAIYWANFAQKYKVEYFTPQNEADIVLGDKEAEKWFQLILPQIRSEYKGEIIIKLGSIESNIDEGDYKIRSETILGDEPDILPLKFSNISGYDYLMVDIYPPGNLKNNKKFLEDLDRILAVAREEVEKKGAKGLMIGEFGYPVGKPQYSNSIIPVSTVSPKTQAKRVEQYLKTAMPKVNGVFYTDWSFKGYGVKNSVAEKVIKEEFSKY